MNIFKNLKFYNKCLNYTLARKNYTTKYNKSYTDFGHAKLKEPKGYVLYMTLLCTIMGSAIFLSPITWVNNISISIGEKIDKILKLPLKLKSDKKSFKVDAAQSQQYTANESEQYDNLKTKQETDNDKKVINYENRLRKFSSLNKIFKYFATIMIRHEDGHSEVLMTLDDFLRVITPGIPQPKELGLEKYRVYDPKTLATKPPTNRLKADSKLEKINRLGFITFADFIFLLMLISTSEKHIKTIFLLYDKDNNGYIDCQEYNQVQRILKGSMLPNKSIVTRYNVSNVGMKGDTHNKHYHKSLTIKSLHNSGFAKFLFGSDYGRKISLDTFFDILKGIKAEILMMEYDLYMKSNVDNHCMNEGDFARCLLKYSTIDRKKKKIILKKLREKYGKASSPQGIKFEDFLKFFNFLNSTDDINLAFDYSTIMGRPIDNMTFNHVVSIISDTAIDEHLLDVCFTIFDINDDGILDRHEFFGVIQSRLNRGMEKKERLSFLKLMSVVKRCALTPTHTN